MASLVTCIVTGATWCFCTACASLLNACCGNDKPSTLPPSVTSGRKRSVLLLLFAIVIALVFQYAVAPAILDAPASVGYIRDAWISGCEDLSDDLQVVCVGNSGVYRPMLAATLFFVLAAVAAACKPTANREAWPAKIILFLFGVLAMCFIPNKPLFADIYLNIARIGGIIFIFAQQLIIVDMAHNWNNSWVTNADNAEKEEAGTGKKWLAAILVACFLLFGAALGGLIYMFTAFLGCPSNNTFISLTLIFAVAITAAQMSGEEGSLLSSACISAWAVYLLYNAVSRNPDGSCNPMLGEPTVANIVLGLVVTMISLGYTGWSYTAEDKLRVTVAEKEDKITAVPTPEESTSPEEETTRVKGVVTGAEYGSDQANDVEAAKEDEENEQVDGDNPKQLSNSWRLNLVLAAVACWTAVVLTQWGAIASRGSIANPDVGSVAMWMVIASQWIVLSLYLWTLVAPRLFPNRDFS